MGLLQKYSAASQQTTTTTKAKTPTSSEPADKTEYLTLGAYIGADGKVVIKRFKTIDGAQIEATDVHKGGVRLGTELPFGLGGFKSFGKIRPLVKGDLEYGHVAVFANRKLADLTTWTVQFVEDYKVGEKEPKRITLLAGIGSAKSAENQMKDEIRKDSFRVISFTHGKLNVPNLPMSDGSIKFRVTSGRGKSATFGWVYLVPTVEKRNAEAMVREMLKDLLPSKG